MIIIVLHGQTILSKVQTDSKINMVSQHLNLTFQCMPHNVLQLHAPRLQQAFLVQMLHRQEKTPFSQVLSKFHPN
jgi:hypothetical protein